jgi:hypothetical protein
VIKFVSDLQQVGDFLLSPPISSTNKTDHHNITEIALKVALNTIKPTNQSIKYIVKLSLLNLIKYYMYFLCNIVSMGVWFKKLLSASLITSLHNLISKDNNV